eukprot:1157385-Pelagomonas_calceolata.AAC.5
MTAHARHDNHRQRQARHKTLYLDDCMIQACSPEFRHVLWQQCTTQECSVTTVRDPPAVNLAWYMHCHTQQAAVHSGMHVALKFVVLSGQKLYFAKVEAEDEAWVLCSGCCVLKCKLHKHCRASLMDTATTSQAQTLSPGEGASRSMADNPPDPD